MISTPFLPQLTWWVLIKHHLSHLLSEQCSHRGGDNGEDDDGDGDDDNEGDGDGDDAPVLIKQHLRHLPKTPPRWLTPLPSS